MELVMEIAQLSGSDLKPVPEPECKECGTILHEYNEELGLCTPCYFKEENPRPSPEQVFGKENLI